MLERRIEWPGFANCVRTILVPILLLAIVAGCAQVPIVSVDDERLVGFVHPQTRVNTFLGVAYAEPPLGDLRWAAPLPLRTKQASRQAKQFAPACMQTMRILDWYRDLAETFGARRDAYGALTVSEDCLYLNIWTPTLSGNAALPVMVYVHGGSNNSGWAYEPPYHGDRLAAQGVVVVTIAYRLGLFGFLSHPEIDGDARANFGLWDQVAALRWIQKNIASFGGDPSRVMMFGESAGAEDILALLHAPPADGLIHRAALHSTAGFGLSQPTVQQEQQRGKRFAKHLGLDSEGSLDALRRMPAEHLLVEYEKLFGDHYHSPAIDGHLINESTWNSINHSASSVPIIIGSNADEWRESVDKDATPESVRTIAAQLKYIDEDTALAAVSGETDSVRALDRLFTADEMLCPSQYTAARWNTHGTPAWNYFFTRVRDGDAGKKVGAFHGAEYTYVFGTNYAGMPVTPIDVALEQTMMSYWVNFAATGNPNGPQLPAWPIYKPPEYKAQQLGDRVMPVSRPEALLCEAFDRRQAERSFSNHATSQ